MENMLMKEYQLPKAIIDEFEEKGINSSALKVLNFIEVHKQHHLWYSGDVIMFNHEEIDIFLSALGAINITLLDKVNNEELVHIKDKFNSGKAYDELSRFIKNDMELKQIILGKHPKYELHVFTEMNWWEAYIGYNGEKYDIMWDLDADTVTEAIIEVFKDLDSIYEFFSESYIKVGRA